MRNPRPSRRPGAVQQAEVEPAGLGTDIAFLVLMTFDHGATDGPNDSLGQRSSGVWVGVNTGADLLLAKNNGIPGRVWLCGC